MTKQPASEAQIQQEIRLASGDVGSVLFRNNQGAFKDAAGRLVRYGICNPGGSDLIGWTPVTVTQGMVGSTVAVFTAIECKRPGGRVTEPQQRFIDAVRKAGGIAGIAHSSSEFKAIAAIYRA